MKYPYDKGRQILSWIRLQVPHPWPEATVRGVNKIVRKWRTSKNNNFVFWNPKRPANFSVTKWRRLQVSKYIAKYPSAKGSAVVSWLGEHQHNPWPEASVKVINNIIRYLKPVPEMKQNFR